MTQHILLGITGGIAAYKAPELVRRLREVGADVKVVMTQGACEFITPLTLQAVSGNPVYTSLFDESESNAMAHIALARWADQIIIAPASANFCARLAMGMADDLLSTVCLATRANLLLAPAMNQQMWEHAATQENIRCLQQRGVVIAGPGEGEQACGEIGPGRMLEPDQLVRRIQLASQPQTLKGTRVLITAGPTQEAIDPVRYITNHSTGKMGYAIAQAAKAAGAMVTVISGPTLLDAPDCDQCINVVTAQSMHDAVMQRINQADIFIACAAVADYRPSNINDKKLKKTEKPLSIDCVRTPDILASVTALADKPYTVGFAAETEQVIENAKAKLTAKNLDLIVANQVGQPDTGFGSETNTLTILDTTGQITLPCASKVQLACELVTLIAERYKEAQCLSPYK